MNYDICKIGCNIKHIIRLSRVTAKLVCALLLKYYYSTIGYDVICFTMGSSVLDRLGQIRMESTGFR